ncbi:twin-arginine translocase TatA/TatE family subunit [Tissierella praeacuta]
MFGKIGATELVLILGIALVVFGPSKLPKIGKAFGSVIGEVQKSR